MGTKTALITGANSGLGLATAKALALRSFDLILLCRNEQKGRVAKADIQKANPAVGVDLFLADLTDAEAIRQAAAQIRAKYPKLDVLINNAGYSPARIEFTEDDNPGQESLEKSFYANHIGHFILTHHLLDALRTAGAETGDARVIALSSGAYALGRKARFFRRIEKLSPTFAYADGKLANLLFAKALAKQVDGQGITAYSAHPGVVSTNFGSDSGGLFKVALSAIRPFMRSPEKGAQTTVFLASAPLKSIGERNNGGYFADSQPKAVHNRDASETNADWLWEKSLAYV